MNTYLFSLFENIGSAFIHARSYNDHGLNDSCFLNQYAYAYSEPESISDFEPIISPEPESQIFTQTFEDKEAEYSLIMSQICENSSNMLEIFNDTCLTSFVSQKEDSSDNGPTRRNKHEYPPDILVPTLSES